MEFGIVPNIDWIDTAKSLIFNQAINLETYTLDVENEQNIHLSLYNITTLKFHFFFADSLKLDFTIQNMATQNYTYSLGRLSCLCFIGQKDVGRFLSNESRLWVI